MTETNTRIPANDPLIPFLIYTHQVWEPHQLSPDEYVTFATDYRDRETFMEICKTLITRDDMLQFPWEIAKYGAHPGGPAYATTVINKFETTSSGIKSHHPCEVTFGIDGDRPDLWYVAWFENDEYQESISIPWRDISAHALAHYIKQYVTKIRGY